ncbi:MAG: 3-oxoacyl-ACP reductase FabG [Clostridia bacterium]|nr:3-oxoacyl-ACP reductase FabG [Clostridia bacterium]
MKTVLITGGSRGIGAEMVRRYAQNGYRVAFVYRQSVEVAENLSRETGALAICADVSKEVDVCRAVSEARENLGGIDVLVNNAAVSAFSLFTDITTNEWNRLISVNLNGAFYFCREILPEMIARKSGRIINISSMWGQVGASCEVHYSVTKAALIGLTKSLAKEVGPSGVTVNCIAPGLIETDMNASLDGDALASLCEETPLGRIGQPSDVAACALFLSGEGGDFITGQVIGVNGGFVI